MSTASAAERPEGAGFVAWLAHRFGRFLAVVVVLTTVQAVTRLLGGELAAVFGWTGLAALVLWMVSSSLASWHYSTLCAACIAAVPPDGAARAARRVRTLRLVHWLGRPWRQLAFVGVVILAQNLVIWATGRESVASTLAAWLVTMCWFVGLSWAGMVVHRPLVPWCPYCRWGRGDDDAPHECVPDPVPPSIVPDRVSS